jgi:hypothetical protein
MVYEPKFIQISTNSCSEGRTWLFALDSDGNVWELLSEKGERKWEFVGSPAGIEKP